MPRRAPSPCRGQGGRCPALTEHGWCPPCQKARDQRDRQQRGTAAERGYGRTWGKYAQNYRRKHPYCVACAARGVVTIAEQVDHITPVRGPADPLFWDHANHQGLCTSCHSRKTVMEDQRGIGKAWVT